MNEENENIPEEELRISDQDHTMDSENEIARKTRIKHRRGPRKKKEKRRISKAAKKRIAITCGSIVGIVAVAYFGGVIFFRAISIREQRSTVTAFHSEAFMMRRIIWQSRLPDTR